MMYRHMKYSVQKWAYSCIHWFFLHRGFRLLFTSLCIPLWIVLLIVKLLSLREWFDIIFNRLEMFNHPKTPLDSFNFSGKIFLFSLSCWLSLVWYVGMLNESSISSQGIGKNMQIWGVYWWTHSKRKEAESFGIQSGNEFMSMTMDWFNRNQSFYLTMKYSLHFRFFFLSCFSVGDLCLAQVIWFCVSGIYLVGSSFQLLGCIQCHQSNQYICYQNIRPF